MRERPRRLVVHLLLRARRTESVVEAVVLRLRLVQPQVVDAAHLVVGVVDLRRRARV